jgi:WD40 repeat protein
VHKNWIACLRWQEDRYILSSGQDNTIQFCERVDRV